MISVQNVSKSFGPVKAIQNISFQIKKGEVVRWVNNDNVAHLLASMHVIGEQGIFSPRVAPGNSWEYRFDKAGEYYYICFIHKVMYGKVTVVE